MNPFKSSVMKFIQAIGVILRAQGLRQLEYLSLIKMLYITDRESIKDRGRPVTGDAVVAMKNGPVLSEIYDLINSSFTMDKSLSVWTRFLTREEYDLILNEDPGVSLLSPYEVQKLEEIAKRYLNYGWREMVKIAHDLPEWLKNDPAKFGEKMKRIPLADIFEAVGRANVNESIEDAEVATVCREQLQGAN